MLRSARMAATLRVSAKQSCSQRNHVAANISIWQRSGKRNAAGSSAIVAKINQPSMWQQPVATRCGDAYGIAYLAANGVAKSAASTASMRHKR